MAVRIESLVWTPAYAGHVRNRLCGMCCVPVATIACCWHTTPLLHPAASGGRALTTACCLCVQDPLHTAVCLLLLWHVAVEPPLQGAAPVPPACMRLRLYGWACTCKEGVGTRSTRGCLPPLQALVPLSKKGLHNGLCIS
jgi:hypothetical protein